MPFLERLFLKAADVTDVIQKTYGMPDLTSSGTLVSYARLNPGKTIFDGRRGVTYLENCWKTIPELVTFSDATEITSTCGTANVWRYTARKDAMP